jgi:superfamily II DNA or RNA helicase
MSRNEELQDRLCNAGWDLAVFDEAHKLAAHYFGSKLEKTGRFRFAERLGEHARHLLLMTATPHNGKEEDFQLFLSLLDSDRFYGKFRDGVHKVDASDLMRRMVKSKRSSSSSTARRCSPSGRRTRSTTSSPTSKPRSTRPSPNT